jgi:hypothetical protein
MFNPPESKGTEMRKYSSMIGLFSLLSLNVNPAAAQAESCEQIRTQIKAQTGVLPKPDTVMLGKVGEHPECRFTAAEAYRAAYGDKPMPKDERRERRSKHRDGD